MGHNRPFQVETERLSLRRCRKRTPGLGLRAESSEHHDAFGIDAKAGAGVRLDQPSELHQRTTSGVENRLLDVLGVAVDLIAVPADDGHLGCVGGRQQSGGRSRAFGHVNAHLTGSFRARLPAVVPTATVVQRAATIARGVLIADAANLPLSPSHRAG